jgi:hypothetical protein
LHLYSLFDFNSYLLHIKEVITDNNYIMSKNADPKACTWVFLFNQVEKFIIMHSDASFSMMVVSRFGNKVICIEIDYSCLRCLLEDYWC